jgi:hypothetical protein
LWKDFTVLVTNQRGLWKTYVVNNQQGLWKDLCAVSKLRFAYKAKKFTNKYHCSPSKIRSLSRMN